MPRVDIAIDANLVPACELDLDQPSSFARGDALRH